MNTEANKTRNNSENEWLDTDDEECQVDNCHNKINTQICIPCQKRYCPFHLPTKNHDHDFKISKRRCELPGCRKKLNITAFPCHCGGYYCSIHMPAEKHDCVFDYKNLGREELEENLVKCVKPKVKKF